MHKKASAFRLAQIAKAHGVPLIGDWRYAAKLIRKAQHSKDPERAKRLWRTLGFLTPEEQTIIRQHTDSSIASGKSTFDLDEYALRYHTSKGFQHGAGTGLTSGAGLLSPLNYRYIHTHPTKVSQFRAGEPTDLTRWPETFLPSPTLDDGFVSEYAGKTINDSIRALKTPATYEDFYPSLGDIPMFLSHTNIKGTTNVISSPSTKFQGVHKTRYIPNYETYELEPVIKRMYFKSSDESTVVPHTGLLGL